MVASSSIRFSLTQSREDAKDRREVLCVFAALRQILEIGFRQTNCEIAVTLRAAGFVKVVAC